MTVRGSRSRIPDACEESQSSNKVVYEPSLSSRAGKRVSYARQAGLATAKVVIALVALALPVMALQAAVPLAAQEVGVSRGVPAGRQTENLPPRVVAARRFLAERGWTPARGLAARLSGSGARAGATSTTGADAGAAATATWQPVGPTAVQTPSFGLVTGRVAALALDPSDATGNHLYLGTTGGGVWVAQNAGTSSPSSIAFTPLTDTLAALGGAADASISIGALTVQPGGTGVILAGTGDPNDVLDSYYGAGILRSADGGNSWSLICENERCGAGPGRTRFSFVGEGFAGFAWSTVNPQLVVAAVSQAYEGTLVNAEHPGNSYEGLYYSVGQRRYRGIWPR